MPRIPRIFLNTEYFHIMTQGINQSYIFDNPIDIKFYIKNMYDIKEKYNINIISYCIMNNHAHILVKCENIKNLSSYMHDLNTSYGCYYNKKYNRKGYVFKDRYKAEGIYTERHLDNCIKYIYNNPVKAGICNKPEEYLYSNYKPINGIDIGECEYEFRDIEEENEKVCQRGLKKFLLENNITFEQLIKDENELHRLFVILKRDYKVSLREISNNFKLNREKVRRIHNKN